MDIKKKANYLARKYQTRNPFEILQGLNAILVFVPLAGTRAFYQYFQRNNIIYINENLSQHEQIFECAHEMGHMLLHKKANAIFMDTRTCFNTNKFEIFETLLRARLQTAAVPFSAWNSSPNQPCTD